jgi:lipopolysaccharide export system protein LptA
MALNPRRLRLWFAIAITLLILLAAGFYFRGYYARYLIARTINKKAEKLGLNIQQSANGFSLSKSEGGRTLFTVQASKAAQEITGHAELRDVNIVAYGNQGNRFDQIYGKSFEYDPKTGIIHADGEVHIDLQGVAEGNVRPDLTPPRELKNPIHLLTSGLQFNRNTGIASTNQRLEFRIPQASGSAVGATYDSKAAALTLHSQIDIQDGKGAHLTAESGLITKEPERIQLQRARITRPGSVIDADELMVYLRPDNSIDRILGTGNVTASTHGKSDAQLQAPRAEVILGEQDRVRIASLSGGVKINASGNQPMHGTAGRVVLDFGSNNRLDKVHALDQVHLVQDPPKERTEGQSLTLDAQAVDFNVNGQRQAETAGPGQIVLASEGGKGKTIATSDRFIARFDSKGHLQTLVGSPNARVVSQTPGQPDKTTTSHVLTLTMAPTGGLAGIVQEGSFHFVEAPSKPGQTGSEATAEKAAYDPQTEMFALTGSPRVTDAGATTTADHMRVNRRTGDALADGSVKTTYSQLQSKPNGALLASSDPIHVTAASMAAHRSNGTAKYSGGARLWQGSRIVEAPTIDFDRDHRTVVAQGKTGQPVSTVFVQESQNGKQTPVNVTGLRLTYQDSERQARFEGGVILRSAEGAVSADHLTVYLQPRGQAGEKTGSQLEKIVAEGKVVIQQEGRRGTGDKLVYLAKDGSFTLTGGSPSIFDAEHGQVTGVSLTFFSHDDRVLVEGGKSAPSVTKARVVK